MIVKNEIFEQLSSELSLPFSGTEQDWPIEAADSGRVDTFLEFYEQHDLSNDKKVGLMALILASYEGYLEEKGLENDNRWDRIKKMIQRDRTLFHQLIAYWSLEQEKDPEELFRISKLLRRMA